MQPRRNGLLTTVLMIIPMLAVPLMAIFGIPQFAAVVASPDDRDSEFDFPVLNERRVGQSDVAPGRTVSVAAAQPIDLFRPYGSQQSTGHTEASDVQQRPTNWTDPLHSAIKESPAPERPSATSNRMAGTPTVHDSSVRSARPIPQQVYDVFSDNFDQRQAAAPANTARKNFQVEFPQLTWREAVDRLNALGASTYRLTPGLHPQEFRFVCFVTSVDDLRITRRFEAEAGDPLVAVEKVLAQVEQWRK